MAQENSVSRDPEDSRAKCDGCRSNGERQKEIKGMDGEVIGDFHSSELKGAIKNLKRQKLWAG